MTNMRNKFYAIAVAGSLLLGGATAGLAGPGSTRQLRIASRTG